MPIFDRILSLRLTLGKLHYLAVYLGKFGGMKMEGRAWIWAAVVVVVVLLILWWTGVFGGRPAPAPMAPAAPATETPAPAAPAAPASGG